MKDVWSLLLGAVPVKLMVALPLAVNGLVVYC